MVAYAYGNMQSWIKDLKLTFTIMSHNYVPFTFHFIAESYHIQKEHNRDISPLYDINVHWFSWPTHVGLQA